MKFITRKKKELTEKQRNRRFVASCCVVGSVTLIAFAIFLLLDCGNVIDGQNLNTAIRNVMHNHGGKLNYFCYILFYLALFIFIGAYVGTSAWIIATKTEKRWLALLLCNSLIFLYFMNVYVSAFLQAGWKEVFDMYSTIITTIASMVMAATAVDFGVKLKNNDKKNERQANTEE